MSHNYPYRQAPADPAPRSDPRTYGPAGGANIYRRPRESFPSSSRSSAAPPSPQDGVLSLLSSCGLEPEDLAVLAKLPEDVLTVDSLPHLINQIKGKRGTVKPFVPRPPSPPPPSSSSHSFSSAHRPPASSAHRPSTSSSSSLDWDKLRRQPVQYPLHMIPSSSPLSDPRSDPWGSPGSVGSSSVRPAQDTDLRPRLSDYGKAASSCSSAELTRSRPSRFSDPGSTDYRSVPPPDERRRRRSGSGGAREPAGPVPSKQQGLDFHGSLPPVYPYSCSLCEITVLSEKVWLEHINGTVHADGQLKLLQQFPNWDCRVKHSNRDEDQSHRRRAGASSAPLAQRANRSQVAQPNRKLVTPTDRGRVVCVKFPAQSVDEAYLQSCIEPFGKMGKILMFPSVAFVELGTADQAKDLVKYYNNLDPSENKRQLNFSVSNTFSFLQSSQVVSFTPGPSGRDGRSDLLSVIKRFGEPLYSLFLPSKVFVEMKFAADAKKLVDYYSSNILKMNGDSISVSFSTEYKSLMRVSLATRCDEEPTQTTTSGAKEPGSERRTRSRSRDRSRSRLTGRPRIRSRSRERGRGRSGQRSRSRNRSRRDRRTRTRTRSRENKDKSSKETKSTSEDTSNNNSTGHNQTDRKTEEPGGSEKPEEPATGTETRPAAEPEDQSGPEAAQEEKPGEERPRAEQLEEEKPKEEEQSKEEQSKEEKLEEEKPEEEQPEEEQPEEEQPEEEQLEEEQPEEEQPEEEQPEEEQLEEEQKFSADDSDIEGMEVIAEDGEQLQDEDERSQEEEESQEETSRPEETAASPEGDDDIEVKSMELDEEEEEEEESRVMIEEEHEAADTEDDEESGFPVDLENCITLDEVGSDEGEDEGGSDQDQEAGSGSEGFVKMSTPSEAQTADQVLESEPVLVNRTRLMGCLSQEYPGLTDGWAVPSDREEGQNLNESSTDKTPELETTLDQRMTSKDDTSGTTPQLETKTDETLELETSETFQETKTDETSEMFQETKTDETSEMFQETKTDETSDTIQETKTKETSELKTSETFQETKTDETPEKETETTSIRRTRSKRIPQTTSDRETRSKKTPDKASQRRTRSKVTPEETETVPDTKTSVEETSETEASEKTPETDSSSKTCEKEQTGRKTVKGKTTSRKSPETRTDKRKGTPEDDAVPLKTTRTDLEEEEALKETNQPKDGEGKSSLDRPEPAEQDMDYQPAPAEGATEPEKLSKPVGPEFVRPVVGYFCNLCQLIFIDEDEAKQQHCSTPEHYRKYQEKTGKDPWSS